MNIIFITLTCTDVKSQQPALSRNCLASPVKNTHTHTEAHKVFWLIPVGNCARMANGQREGHQELPPAERVTVNSLST